MLHWELRKVSSGAQKALTASRNLCASTSVSRAISIFLLCAQMYATSIAYCNTAICIVKENYLSDFKTILIRQFALLIVQTPSFHS